MQNSKEKTEQCKWCGKQFIYSIYVHRDIPDCNCSLKRVEANEKGKELIQKIKRIKDCGLGLLYHDRTFSNFDTAENKKAYTTCLEFARNIIRCLKDGTGLFLCGDVGTGKTHLSAAIVDYAARMKKRVIKNSFYILYTTTADLIADVINSFSQDKTSKQIYDKYKDATLLILDELGVERQTEFSREIIYQIVNYRYSNKLATLYLSNLNDRELSEKIGKRIVSRIYERCVGVKLTGKDYRINNKIIKRI